MKIGIKAFFRGDGMKNLGWNEDLFFWFFTPKFEGKIYLCLPSKYFFCPPQSCYSGAGLALRDDSSGPSSLSQGYSRPNVHCITMPYHKLLYL